MSGKHTPGPWDIRSEDLRGGKYWVVVIPGCDETVDLHEDDNGEANACLIASAPDLLEELKDLLRQTEAVSRVHNILFDTQGARAAIAAAEGNSNG